MQGRIQTYQKRISFFESRVEFFRSPNNFFKFAKIIELLNLTPVVYNSLMGSEQEGVVNRRTFWSCFFWKRAEFLPEFRNFVDDIAAVRVNCKLNELSTTVRNTKPLQQMHSDRRGICQFFYASKIPQKRENFWHFIFWTKLSTTARKSLRGCIETNLLSETLEMIRNKMEMN